MERRRLKTALLLTLSLLITLSSTRSLRAAGLGVTPAEQFSVPEGFAVELLYDVPGDREGSWVSLTVDPQGRLIACDQYGGLYRIDVSGKQAKVEKLTIDFTGAQGLLCAFGSLVRQRQLSRQRPGTVSGVWRLTDTDGDDQYDKKEHSSATQRRQRAWTARHDSDTRWQADHPLCRQQYESCPKTSPAVVCP